MTHYINTDARRICYAFEVPGVWELGRESGVVRRGRGVVGVAPIGVREIGASSIDDAIHRAAARSDEIYRAERAGVPSQLAPDPAVPGTWRWDVPGESDLGEGRSLSIPPRWYLPVGQEWIAQFTVGHPPGTDRETFAADLVRSLTTSREPRCYEARLRQLLRLHGR